MRYFSASISIEKGAEFEEETFSDFSTCFMLKVN